MRDTQLPSISCPADLTVNVNAGLCVATGVVLGTPITSDNCSTVTVSSNAPVQFPVGTNVVIWTATDASGNTASCQQRVIVRDNLAPVISCPANIVVNAAAGQCQQQGEGWQWTWAPGDPRSRVTLQRLVPKIEEWTAYQALVAHLARQPGVIVESVEFLAEGETIRI